MSTATAVAPNPFLSKAVAEGSYENCPPGNKRGILVALMDYGTFDETYENVDKDTGKKSKTTKEVRKIALYWELGGPKQKDGKPFVLGLNFNYGPNMGPKAAFRKMLQEWRGSSYGEGEEIDPLAMMDVPCMVNVIGNKVGDKTYSNIASIAPADPDMAPLARSREPLIWHVSMGEPPDTSWLPRIYGKTFADMLKDCKERGGSGIEKRKDDASASAAIDPAKKQAEVEHIERLAARVIELAEGHPGKDACILEIEKIMKEVGLIQEDLGDCGRTLISPF